MKKTNFWKGLTMAAVALVSVFATSCSEENLTIEGVDIPETPEVVLPDAKASVSITVVDLEAGKTIGSITNIDATSAIGSTITVECPANEGYTTAKAITVSIPKIEKGQAIVIPVTFYVVTTASAYADLDIEIDYENIDFDYVEEHELTFMDENGWVNGSYTNETYEDVESTLVLGNYYTGAKFEVEESRAAETTVEDLLGAHLVFTVGELEIPETILARATLAFEPIIQKIHVTKGYIFGEDGDIELEFEALVAGALKAIISEYTYLDDPDHTHDHTHGHGHGAGNAGGGEGGDNAGE